MADYFGLRDCGSSPRVRGTPRTATGHQGSSRFIPACAGNTGIICEALGVPSVHPRVCGEHSSASGKDAPPCGSSPRVRGTRIGLWWRRCCVRFIPACAGNTDPACACPGSGTVHPRVCGEHPNLSAAVVAATGSSPRVRGTLPRRHDRAERRRFIPACAGNTQASAANCVLQPVHPRVCGEHDRRQHGVSGNGGSSPRVRGTPMAVPCMMPAMRFIPACAGNTRVALSESGVRQVHPRVCGEHAPVRACTIISSGSSPRVRGTRVAGVCGAAATGFIPACAGNTNRASCHRLRAPVHPRVCGEHLL